jgi:hypothetical protein
MNKLLTFAAILEAVTGLALIAAPSVVARLLLGAELSGAALAWREWRALACCHWGWVAGRGKKQPVPRCAQC